MKRTVFASFYGWLFRIWSGPSPISDHIAAAPRAQPHQARPGPGTAAQKRQARQARQAHKHRQAKRR